MPNMVPEKPGGSLRSKEQELSRYAMVQAVCHPTFGIFLTLSLRYCALREEKKVFYRIKKS